MLDATHHRSLASFRTCGECGKRLARLNRGPWCYACQQSGAPALADAPTRSRRARLPHDQIVARYREMGDTTAVAREFGLARSSVWYVIERAKQDGRLPGRDDRSANEAA
jgi:hypothetical protein